MRWRLKFVRDLRHLQLGDQVVVRVVSDSHIGPPSMWASRPVCYAPIKGVPSTPRLQKREAGASLADVGLERSLRRWAESAVNLTLGEDSILLVAGHECVVGIELAAGEDLYLM